MLSRIRHIFRRPPEVIVVPAPLQYPLDARERKEISDWLDHPTTRKVLGLMEARHPGTQTRLMAKVARSEWDQLAAVNFLNRIHGWESYRNALMTLADPPKSNEPLVETYPNQ
jgi:hypothetical protein